MKPNFNGSWRNQNDSLLELTEHAGIVTGRFCSRFGMIDQPDWVDVSGRTLDDVITFNALFPKFGTVISWVGQLTVEAKKDVIKTLWLHATNIPDDQEPRWLWYSNRVGADDFVRVETVLK